MATITMDTSEYEIMKKYQAQLEESLKREKDLSIEITGLQDKLAKQKEDRIKELEGNQDKVVILNKTMVVNKISNSNKYTILSLIGKLARAYDSHRFAIPSYEDYKIDDIEKLLNETEQVSLDTTEVSYVGFADIKKDLKKSITEEVTTSLKYNKKELENRIERLLKQLKTEGENRAKGSKEINDLQDHVKNLENTNGWNRVKMYRILGIAETPSLFGNRAKLDEIRFILLAEKEKGE